MASFLENEVMQKDRCLLACLCKKAAYEFKEIIFTGKEAKYTIKMSGKGLEGTHTSDMGKLKEQEDLEMIWQRTANKDEELQEICLFFYKFSWSSNMVNC